MNLRLSACQVHPTQQLGRLAQWRASLTAHQGVAGLDPVRPHTFVDIHHEIISNIILPLPLIQEQQMSDSGESMCTK